MNGITALEARIEDAEDHEVDLKDRVEELEARVAKLEEAVMFLLEDEEVPFESEDGADEE